MRHRIMEMEKQLMINEIPVAIALAFPLVLASGNFALMFALDSASAADPNDL